MILDLDLRRRFFAEEIEAVAKLRSPRLVDAFAAVPRERFLPAGPWTVLSDSGEGYVMMSGIRLRPTADADPARVYHNIAVAIDADRHLFNGQPATIGVWIDTLELAAGTRLLHVGAGLGYYTAVMAECVGPQGRVVAYEIDEALAGAAARNLAAYETVDLRYGDGASPFDERFDAVLVNAGVTHPLDTWLDALSPGGRMLLPLTAPMPVPGATLGKGVVILLTKESDGSVSARIVAFVAAYSALGVRDPAMDEPIGKALTAGPGRWQAVRRLRRDRHDPDGSCWLHRDGCCFSAM
ncbi:MAG TPA: methyltransferase domain-containing protein [Vicinamibacterales bacterium]|nr:methyltransferase domain-containing protein [Vicinamibacterales bacterium]